MGDVLSVPFIVSCNNVILEFYGFQDQEKKCIWLPILKIFKRWVPMNFHGTKKLSRMVSNYGQRIKRKIVFHGNWNPGACIAQLKATSKIRVSYDSCHPAFLNIFLYRFWYPRRARTSLCSKRTQFIQNGWHTAKRMYCKIETVRRYDRTRENENIS